MAEAGLAGLPYECFELVESVTHHASDLRERWDNRLILERSSLAELYLNNRIEIVLYGEWGVEREKVDWFCRVTPSAAVFEDHSGGTDVDVSNLGDCDCRQDEIMLVVVVEGVEGPQSLVASVGRPYLVQKQVSRPGQGGLYRLQILNGRSGGGYKFFPFASHGEVPLRLPVHSPANAGSEMIQGPAEVVSSISDHQCDKFSNWLKGAIAERKAGWLRVGRDDVRLDGDAVPLPGKGACAGNNLFNVAVGPLNL